MAFSVFILIFATMSYPKKTKKVLFVRLQNNDIFRKFEC